MSRLIVALLLIAIHSVVALKVSVYYETLCPDSKAFITTQLYPNYETLKPVLVVDFVPYGRATQEYTNGSWSFECQHGVNECYGNKYHACVLNQDITQDQRVNFVYCSMSKSNPAAYNTLYNCALKYDITWLPVQQCFQTEADDLLAAYGNRTLAVNIPFVPTIILDDKFDQDVQDESLEDFLEVACEELDEAEKPSACTQTKTKAFRKFIYNN